MSTDLSTIMVVPGTGEVLDIHDPAQMEMAAREHPEAIADFLERLDDAIRLAQDIRADAARYLIDRMDLDATQTLHAGPYTISVNGGSDHYDTFDTDVLRERLGALVASGVLSQAGADKALRVKYEPSKTGINSLRALRDEAVDEALEAAATTAYRKRRATIKRG